MRFSTGICASLLSVASPSLALPQAIEIPFDLGRSSMTVTAVINGRDTAQLLFDTGWHATTLDSAFAAQIGLTHRGEAHRRDVPLRTQADSVRIGPMVTRNMPVRVLNLAGITPPGERHVHGVLGATFLEGRIVQLDFVRQVIRIVDPWGRKANPARDAFVTPMHFSELGLLPIIDSVVIGGRVFRGMIDTGAGLDFLLTPKASETLSLQDAGDAVRAGGYSGERSRQGSARVVTLKRIRVGSLLVDSARVVLAGTEMAHLDQPLGVYGAIVGLHFLRKYRVTLDYRDRIVTFEPT